ncbi:hypothetical protein ACFLU5_14215 [Bacteroidota bacterium]
MTRPTTIKPSTKEFDQQVFFIGLFIILLFQVAGLLLHYATNNHPGFIPSLGVGLLLILMAKSFGDKFNRKQTFIISGALAFLGCFISAPIIINFKDYLEVSHVVGVSMDELINSPDQYDDVSLFYLEDAILRSDIYGYNEVRTPNSKDSTITTYAVYPIVPVHQIHAEIVKVGAWLVADIFIDSPLQFEGYVGQKGALRVNEEREPIYRAAVNYAHTNFGVASDWNAPILELGGEDNTFAAPIQFYWVLLNLLLWPTIWILIKAGRFLWK